MSACIKTQSKRPRHGTDCGRIDGRQVWEPLGQKWATRILVKDESMQNSMRKHTLAPEVLTPGALNPPKLVRDS